MGLRVGPAMTGLAVFVLLFLVACGGGDAPYEPYLPDYPPEQTTTMPDYISEVTDPARELIITIPDLPPEISEYGFRAAVEFLNEFVTLYSEIGFAITTWDEQRRIFLPTGQFRVGWFDRFGQSYTTNVVPKVHFSPDEAGRWGFFDQHNNRIEDAIWISHENYADYFRLFSFDDSGIPVIFVHYSQTSEGGYAGFYRIFRYIDGGFRMLEMDAWIGWLGRVHHLFIDENGRLITFINSPEYLALLNTSI